MTDSKIPNRNIDNRLSPLQLEILCYLSSIQAHGCIDGRIGHLPRTGAVVEGVGRHKDKAGYASVSRSLKRLMQSGHIAGYYSQLCTRGKGMHYALIGGERG